MTFHYQVTGESSTPPLILLQALGRNAQDWKEAAFLLAERYHVFSLDQRSHGESTRPGVYSFGFMRDDLKAFVDALALDRFTLIGHSMGGTVAFLFVERWPDRTERLVIEDTPPPYAGIEDPDAPPPAAEAPGDVSFDWRMVGPLVRQMRTPDPSWWYDLPTITALTLIIGGGQTSHVSQKKLAEVAQFIPQGQLVSIDGPGHFIYKNRSEEDKALLREFLFE